MLKGISPVLTTTILVGAVLVIGISFMSYAVVLSNTQRVEVYIRSLVADEALNTLIYIEKDIVSDSTVSLYVGIVNILNKDTTYYITTFKTDRYGLQAKVYKPLTTSMKYFNEGVFTDLNRIIVDSSKVYIVSLSGDYIPLSTDTVEVYEYRYRHTGLVSITINKELLGSDDYIVVMLLTNVGGDYYELLQLSYQVKS